MFYSMGRMMNLWPLCLWAFVCSGDCTGAEPAQRPDIVIFLADDHGQRDSQVYGGADVHTPNMLQLAREGLVFDRAYVASPSCAPSRAALLTGLMPARNGAEANHAKPHATLKKLPAYLQDLGYEVVAFGKVSHYKHTADYGFDYFAHDTFHDPHAIPAALDWLQKRTSTKPLCLFVGSNWPHVPWPNDGGYDPAQLIPPTSHVDTPATRQERARYYDAVTRMDSELGQIYQAAREKLGTNTVFIHTSDHGAQFPFGKWNCYEAGVRTSMIVVWTGVVPPGKRTAAMIQWTDLLPTLVEIAGGQPPKEIDGRSFLDVLRGTSSTHRDEVFTTHSGDGQYNVYPIRALSTPEWKYIRNLHPEYQHTTHINRAADRDGLVYWSTWEAAAKTNSLAAQVVRRYKERPREELYNLRDDPDELQNLAADPAHTSRLEAMRARLNGWMKDQGDQRTVFNRPILVGQKPPPIRRNPPPKPPSKL